MDKQGNNVIVYKKTGCPWAAAITAFLDALSIPYEVRDFQQNMHFAFEVKTKSGKQKSPTVDLNGHIISDASVEDVAEALEKSCVIA